MPVLRASRSVRYSAVDEWLELFDEHPAVPVRVAARALRGVARGRVLIDPVRASVVDPDHDQGRDNPLPNRLLGRFIEAPLTAERGRLVEEILAILHVQHGIAPLRVLIVARGQIDDDVVLALEKPRAHPLVHTEGAREGVRFLLVWHAGN